MSVQEKFVAPETSAPVAPTPRPPEPKPFAQDETAGLGIAISGFEAAMEGRMARAALVGAKVLLFNFAVFGPIVALGLMLFG